MCSELFRIPLDWLSAPALGGISIGVLLALALVVGIVKLLMWGRRTGRTAEAWAYVPGLLLFAAALVFVPRWIPAIPIRGYGVMVLLGSLTGIGMATYRARQNNLSPDAIYALAFSMFLCGIVGARLFFVIEYWETRFQSDDWRQTLFEALKFTEGGLVVYGALIGATLAFFVFTLRHRLPPLALADLIAPSLLAGLAFGRIGCLLNGCCYGGESTQAWAVTFPPESMPYMEQVATGRTYGIKLVESAGKEPGLTIATVDAKSVAANQGLHAGTKIISLNGQPIQSFDQAQQIFITAFSQNLPLQLKNAEGQSFQLLATSPPPARSRPVHPTQIYSAVHAALLSWVLWSFYPFRRRDGQVTALMLTVYPVSRFLLEIIRIDESAVFGTGLSISQNISIAIFLGAIALWVYLSRQPDHRATLTVE